MSRSSSIHASESGCVIPMTSPAPRTSLPSSSTRCPSPSTHHADSTDRSSTPTHSPGAMGSEEENRQDAHRRRRRGAPSMPSAMICTSALESESVSRPSLMTFAALSAEKS